MSGVDLCQTPMVSPPQGVVPNFVDPPSLAHLPKIFIYITLPLMTIFLALRLYIRLFVSRNHGWDDYLCVLSAAVTIVQIGTMFELFGQSYGPRSWNIPLCKITAETSLFSALHAILFQISAMFAKTSILALYRRIFSPVRLANTLIFSGIAFTVVFYLAAAVAFSVGLIPRPGDYVTKGILSVQYRDRTVRIAAPLGAASGVVGAIIDIYILIVALLFTWDLHISMRRKVGISAIFVTGSTAVIFSIVGAAYRIKLATPNSDSSWDLMPVLAMNVAEINVGIAASCMPVVFGPFKSITERTSFFVTKMWTSVTRRSRGRTETPGGSSSFPLDQYQEMDNDNLPDIPAAEVTGLRSFLGRIGRTNPVAKHEGHSTVMLTNVSEINDYHGHLRNG